MIMAVHHGTSRVHTRDYDSQVYTRIIFYWLRNAMKLSEHVVSITF